jgi:hypothetical protein
MLKKIKAYLEKKQDELKKRNELLKAQKYYQFVKAGQMFISFVTKDLEKAQSDANRHMRRRMQAELNDKGKLSEELVNYYATKIDYVLGEINRRLNPPKPVNNPNVKIQTEKPVDVK